MILGIGTDITDSHRMGHLYERYGNRLLERLFLPEEIKNARGNLASYLASRFAAKEAAVKALGTGFSRGISARQIEIRTSESGLPQLVFYAKARDYAEILGVKKSFLSISHERNCAIAMVLLEG